MKTIQKRKRQAVSYNSRSGVGPVDVPYEDELDRINMMDDSIEPEVIRDVHGATHKKAEFFTEMAKLEEARAVRKARQDELKEERHAAKRKIKEEKCAAKRKLKEEVRLERQEMHREKMRLLAMLVTQPETKQD
ncbi:hypothetical protein HPB47_019511 [Ixodes persulcatus]|uniref:Uncharacterized protein n=1 Tax=Ixodes persulcatus TaxID=34615 RepID=A0AC60QHZ2_IXOPE|nr:hypothetical protein HPB47_019511 [Ixodes persulcatus]